ncbi:MAG: hypothetical protein H8E17_12405 [Deltaproteobacteria bacterium]|nr:hypothetical protein [Deltaproteobacteria bacterium]
MKTKPDNEKLIDALRKAWIYIRTVEALRDDYNMSTSMINLMDGYTEGGEVEAIEAALAELGVIC